MAEPPRAPALPNMNPRRPKRIPGESKNLESEVEEHARVRFSLIRRCGYTIREDVAKVFFNDSSLAPDPFTVFGGSDRAYWSA
jgi:hypothetical protein